MKKIYLAFLAVLCMFGTKAQNTCATAVPITSLPFSSGTLTTCGSVDDYAAGTLYNSNYGGGEDYVFSVSITNAPVTLTLTLGGAGTYKIASVHSACAPTAANAVGGIVTNSATTATGNVSITTNGTYYIIVDTWPTPDCSEFTLGITSAAAGPPPANDVCSGAVVIPAAGPFPYTTGVTSNVDATNTGDATNSCQANSKKGVWYTLTPTVSGPYVISSCQSDAPLSTITDNVISVFSSATGCGGTLTQLTCDDDACTTLNLQAVTTANLVAGTQYFILVYGYDNNTGNVQLKITGPPSCATPTAVTVGSVSANSASVSWSGTGTFLLEYGPAGFTPGTGATAGTNGTVINPATSAQVIGGLAASTTYNVYVRQICAGPEYSANSTLASFTTSCAASPIPYVMPIDGIADFTLPNCTSVQDVNADANTWFGVSDVVPGWTAPFIVYAYDADNPGNDWFYTNGLSLTGGTSYRLTFKYNNDGSVPADGSSYYPEKLKVSYGTSALASAMTTTLVDYPVVANATPQTAVIDFIPPSTGTYYIGFQSYSDADQDILLLDDISVNLTPACPGTSSVAISGVTSAAATATWTGTGTFILEYGPAGFTPGTANTAGATGTLINPATSPQVIGGLAASTAYDVYVRQNCTGTGAGYSTNSPKVSFTTNAVQLLSATSGNWNAPGTWVGGVVPVCSDNVTIVAGHTVTVNNAGNVSNAITISSGATLAVASGDVTVGCTNRNNRLINNGTLNVSGGSLLVNGSVSIPNTANYIQSGGTITVDGNNAGATATSVPSGTPIFAIGSAATSYSTGTVNLTGGTLLITDPHAASGGEAFTYYGAANTANNITPSPGFTLKFGDGVSTDAGGATTGFIYNQWEAFSGFKASVVADGGTGTNRGVTSRYSPSAFQNLTVLSGQFTGTTRMHVERDLLVSGTGILTSPGTILMSTGTFDPVAVSLAESASPNAQSISGNGTIRNLASAPTANLTGLTINNSNPAGVTLGRAITVSGTPTITALTLTAGNLTTTAANLLTIGVSATTRGIIDRTGGMVVGPLAKWFGTVTGSTTFPLGNGVSYKPATINFTTAPTAGGIITGRFSGTAPVFGNASPLNEGALVVNYASTQGSWFLDAGAVTGGTYTATITGNGSTDVIDYTKTVLIKRPSAGGDWVLNGTHVTTTGSNTAPVLSRTAMSGFSEFAIGGELLVALPINIEYFKGAKQPSANLLDWKVNSTSGSVTIVLERSADGRTFTGIHTETANAVRTLQPFSHTDAQPLQGVNYYRLKVTEASGKVTYSQIVLLLGNGRTFELTGLQPNPVLNKAMLNITSATAEKMEIRITDVVGKTISTQYISVIAGTNKIPMNFIKLAAGTYQVTGKTTDGEIKTIRFVKQ